MESDSEDEAFPNAKHLFQQAFAAQDPAPPLLHLLKEHPTYLALCDLVFYYAEAVQNDPYCGKTLASALASIIHSPDAPSFGQDTFFGLLSRRLAWTHFKSCDLLVAQEYGPKNIYILHSLLSGFSLKYNLTASPEMHGAIEDGLKARCGSKESEVLVVGTCIQLLLHGFRLTTDRAGTYQREPGKIAKQLKAHKTAETVKDPHAIEVLEVHLFIFVLKKMH
jgi:hypothetical protein